MPYSGPARTPRTSRAKGRGKLLRIAVACVVLLAITAYVAVRLVTGEEGVASCVVHADGASAGGGGGDYELKPGQAVNAATIAAVASQRGLPERAVTIALATAMQESTLHNIRHGDRDSVGLFQQRPSQGWGTEEQIQDAVYSAGKFYDHLVKIPGYSRLPLTVAAQRVQRSGFPQAYAKHEANATLLTAALTGRKAAALNCTPEPGNDREPGDAERVRAQLVREFGKGVLAEGAGTVTPAAARAGGSKPETAMTVPARGERRGWELAHWALANASALHIERISFAGRVWSAEQAGDGWRESGSGSGAKGGEGTGDGRSGGSVVLRLATGR
ncbi:heavy metal transporter [Streptomyces iconiensis]|uniref:Heavy metal transporter n=1 Tax=Streptomyces iconiensis TaxID=1384038 RepID=A0ABT7A5S6_9ACTN|nr:heavy metal transporter [Streptomyces iconiensis]MDJ1136698.1 heavy metal transporter [Streptomyces iconiensis]